MTAVKRMLQYLEKKGISKYKFYKETGLSNGFLDKGDNIGSDKCEIILSHYTDIRAEWLITGRGPMLKQLQEEPSRFSDNVAHYRAVRDRHGEYIPGPPVPQISDSPQVNEQFMQLFTRVSHMKETIQSKDETIESRDRTIQSLEKIIQQQEKLLERFEKLLDPKSGGKTVTDASRSIRPTPRQLDPKE